MDLNGQHWENICRYLSGDLNEAQRTNFVEWLEESTENEIIFREASKIWVSSRVRYHAADETELLLSKLKARIAREEAKSKIIKYFQPYKNWTKIAASIVLIAATIYIVLWVTGTETTISSGDTVATIYLPDSSKIWLNANSELSYEKAFGEGSRTVALSGEGYFIIRKNENIPFVVTTSEATVKILGTSFNLKEAREETILKVAEGTVEIAASGNEKVTVKAKEQVVLKKNKSVKKSALTDFHFASWRQENNPAYEKERQNPLNYLTAKYSWRKNQINLSVIEGTLKNSASLASYKNVVLEVTYTKPDGSISTAHVNLNEVIEAGETINYQRRLLDIFTDTQSLKVEIVSAQIASSVM